MSEWKKVRLGDVCLLNYGKSLVATKRINGGIPVYSSAGITGWHNQSLINSKAIIVGRKGTVGTVYLSETAFWCIDTAYYILPNDEVYNLKYLYYRLMSLGLNKLNEDSAVPGLNRETAYSQTFNLPPLNEQKWIVDILGSLDDKIELNSRINLNLESQAQALFKRWFVDFEFPDANGNPYKSSGGEFIDSELGGIPKGWKIGSLSDIVSIKYGKDHKKLENGCIPVYGSGGVMRYVEKSLYEQESVLIPRKGTLDNIIYINEPFWSVDTMFYTEMKEKNIAKFVYFFMQSQDLVSMNAGSAVPSMTTEILNKLTVIIPISENLKLFEDIANPIFKAMQNNKQQNKKFTDLRNAILPKLMNNEIKL